MASLLIKPGEEDPIAFNPVQSDGETPDLTDVLMQLRIYSGEACIALDGVLDEDAQLFEVDVNSLELEPGLYPGTIFFDWGDGYRHSGHVNLVIEGGC